MDVATATQACTCADDTVVTWKHIDSMSVARFDAILKASEQVIDLSRQWHACWARGCHAAFTVRETMLQIYSKLVDLLAAAVAAYAINMNTAATPPSLTNGHTKPGRADTRLRQHPDRWPWEPCHMQLPPPSKPESPPARRVVCLPARMLLGAYKLNRQQSTELALDLVCRTLRGFADVLRRMGRRESGDDLAKMDGTLLKLLARVERLSDTSMAGLSASSLQHCRLLHGGER